MACKHRCRCQYPWRTDYGSIWMGSSRTRLRPVFEQSLQRVRNVSRHTALLFAREPARACEHFAVRVPGPVKQPNGALRPLPCEISSHSVFPLEWDNELAQHPVASTPRSAANACTAVSTWPRTRRVEMCQSDHHLAARIDTNPHYWRNQA